MDELIRKKDAIDALMAERKHLLDKGQKGAEHILTHHGYNVIDELPPVQSDVPDTNVGDMISRQAAIDIERNATVDTNPSHFEAHQKFTQFMDDAEVSSFGRWQWSNGFNTALTAVGIDLKKLPSAQPKQTNCEYCHTDRDGYVFPLEKNSHAFIDRDKIVLKANGWRGEAKIKYCPICGRRLTDG